MSSVFLNPDSPMVMYTVDGTDGLVQTVEPDPGGAGGGGGSGPVEGPVAVDQFIALCSVFHTTDTLGTTFDGRWLGALTEQFEAAQADALAHEDGQALVFRFSNGRFLGPVNFP